MRLVTPGRILLVLIGAALCCLAPGAAEPRSLPERVSALVKQLDDNRFAVRHEADRELRSIGVAVVPLLKKEMETRPPLEVYKRLESIVTDLSSIPWKTDLAQAREEAKRAGKPILVFSTIGDVGGFA
ncbi:MAG: thioredoxin family protein [Gemmataceae bacterium]|nr:thioredoxin family protein [Gemmataceae bacterium]